MFYIKLLMVVLFFLWIFASVRKEYRKSHEGEKAGFWKDALAGGAGLMSVGLLLNFVNFLLFDEGLRNLSFFLVLAGMVNASIYIWKKAGSGVSCFSGWRRQARLSITGIIFNIYYHSM
ncbi:hypothetical protein ACQCVO_15860 [Bacillus infantis]|uniref:hypothetical protein n=1 Tax=Bacillus infantis TaxID=324767 RepID=UPI003CF4A01B